MPSIVEQLKRRVAIYQLKYDTIIALEGKSAADKEQEWIAELELIDAQLLVDRELESLKPKVPPTDDDDNEITKQSNALHRKFGVDYGKSGAERSVRRPAFDRGGHATYADANVVPTAPAITAPIHFSKDFDGACDKDDRCKMLKGHDGACGWQEMGHDNKPVVIRANIVARCHTQACVKRKGHFDDCVSSTGHVLGKPVEITKVTNTSDGTLDHSDSV